MTNATAAAATRAIKAPRPEKVVRQIASSAATQDEIITLRQEALRILSYALVDINECISGGHMKDVSEEASSAQTIAYSLCYPNEVEEAPTTSQGLEQIHQLLVVVSDYLSQATGKALYGAILSSELVDFAANYCERLQSVFGREMRTLKQVHEAIDELRALTTFTGAKQLCNRSASPVQQAEDDAITGAQQRAALEFVAGSAHALNEILVMANAAEVGQCKRLADAARAIAQQISVVANEATGHYRGLAA
ncbi:MAG: hypothetical protein F9K35_03620 [Burkholderiaceae bacterium]|nr:MAG: hypothetical protein F9K35_03620 [Burkholderiaceae bacterium]